MTVGYLMMRMTIAVVFAAAFAILGAAQDFIAQSGAPAAAFPKPDRPVADIVSPIWHDEKERDDAGELGGHCDSGAHVSRGRTTLRAALQSRPRAQAASARRHCRCLRTDIKARYPTKPAALRARGRWLSRDQFRSARRQRRLSRDFCATVRCKPHATGSDRRVQDAVADRSGQKLGSFDKSGRDSVAVTLKLVQSARRQRCKYDRHENKRWHISHQMTALGRVAEGLNPHDRRVNHARPHGEPDEALVSVGIFLRR